METTPKQQRQHLGCGYLPRLEKPASIWQPPEDYRGPNLTTCAGYTTNLPIVQEAALMRMHWKHGAIASACDEKPTEALLEAIVVVDCEASAMEAALMEKARKSNA